MDIQLGEERKRSGIVKASSLLLIIVLLFNACQGKSAKQEEPVDEPKKTFSLPIVPSNLTTPKERSEYLLIHYWDSFNFQDTSYIHQPEITEQAIVNYIDIFAHAESDAVVKAVNLTLNKASSDSTGRMFRYVIDMMERYIHDPNSPVRNEDAYIPFAEYIIVSSDPVFTEADKEKARFGLEMALKNRVGDIAADFTYTLASGKTGTMHQLKSEYTLLYFYNPDCNGCAEYTQIMKDSPHLQAFFEQGLLKILAVYPDEDISLWRSRLANIPDSWINAYDTKHVLINKKIYDLGAIPTIYLLDKDKRVILKDAQLNKLFEWIEKNNMGQPMVMAN